MPVSNDTPATAPVAPDARFLRLLRRLSHEGQRTAAAVVALIAGVATAAERELVEILAADPELPAHLSDGLRRRLADTQKECAA